MKEKTNNRPKSLLALRVYLAEKKWNNLISVVHFSKTKKKHQRQSLLYVSIFLCVWLCTMLIYSQEVSIQFFLFRSLIYFVVGLIVINWKRLCVMCVSARKRFNTVKQIHLYTIYTVMITITQINIPAFEYTVKHTKK